MAKKKKSESLSDRQRRMQEVLKVFKATYPDAKCSLNYETPFQLLVATILSAQCTDERVNKVTPSLFKKYPTAQALSRASLNDVEKLIQSTGFFKNKAKSLVECSKSIMALHGGSVPRTLEELTALRGVGRKTANVVLGNAFDTPGLVVDTHVGRLSRRLGFTAETDPEKVEQELMQIVPRQEWTLFAHLLICHGRARCIARKPDCLRCEVSGSCPRVGVTQSTERPARAPQEVEGKSLT
ncbi:MAG: endonuclease III [Bdellovibrionota bacterium]